MSPNQDDWSRVPDTSGRDDNERWAAGTTSPYVGGGGPSETGGAGPEEPGPVTPSWERRAEIGLTSALFKTIGEVLVDPVNTFRHMPVTGGLGGPLLFAVLLGTVGVIFQAFYNMMGFGLQMMSTTMGVEEVGMNVLLTLIMMILSPILVTVGTFIGAGILHLFLMLFGGANRGFEATFRVIAYVGGATALFNAIPICGGLILFVWSTVCEVIGAKEAHQTTTWQALLAVLTPLLLCCCCVAAMMAAGVSLLAPHAVETGF